MADICDTTDMINERALQANIDNARTVKRHLIANGVCYNCNEEVTHPNALFCDHFCAIDYDKRKRNAR